MQGALIFALVLQSQQDAYDAQVRSLKDRMAAELRRQKHDWNLKETEKREKWMKEQKEEILHTTAKVRNLSLAK